MNRALKAGNVGISPCSLQSIKGSLKGVAQGTMTEKEAHAREAESFREDSRESLAHGRVRQGLLEDLGSRLNAGAARGLDTFEKVSKRLMPGLPSTLPRRGSGGGGGGGGGGGW